MYCVSYLKKKNYLKRELKISNQSSEIIVAKMGEAQYILRLTLRNI